MSDDDTIPDPEDPVTTIRHIGPAQARALSAAGIHTATALRDLGADAAYRRLLHSGERPHFIAYYALHMALQGRPWNDCKGAEKSALRIRFDALKAAQIAAGNDPELERILDRIGLGLRR